jgi:hypothetical protein
MRRISLALVFLVALASLPLTAEPLRRERDERRFVARVVRVVKAIFRIGTHGDGLIPPDPVVPPRP